MFSKMDSITPEVDKTRLLPKIKGRKLRDLFLWCLSSLRVPLITTQIISTFSQGNTSNLTVICSINTSLAWEGGSLNQLTSDSNPFTKAISKIWNRSHASWFLTIKKTKKTRIASVTLSWVKMTTNWKQICRMLVLNINQRTRMDLKTELTTKYSSHSTLRIRNLTIKTFWIVLMTQLVFKFKTMSTRRCKGVKLILWWPRTLLWTLSLL